MPTTVRRTPFTSTGWPTRSGRPPNADCQISCDRTTTCAPLGRVSATSKVRPASGFTPSALKRSAETSAVLTCRGWSDAVRFAWLVVKAPTTEKAFVRSWNSRNSGGDTQNWSNPIAGNALEM